MSAKWGRHAWPSLVAYRENKGDWGPHKEKEDMLTLQEDQEIFPNYVWSEILLQPAYLKDPVIFILLVDSSLWDFYSNVSSLSSNYPTPKRFTCLNDPCDIFGSSHCSIKEFSVTMSGIHIVTQYLISSSGALHPLSLPGAPFPHCWITPSSGRQPQLLIPKLQYEPLITHNGYVR